MTISVPIDAETEAHLRTIAQQAGKELKDYVAEIVQSAATAPATPDPRSAADFDDALDELFAGDTRKLPAMALTYSREDIYHDHD
jgi:hypothetical protein